MTTPERVNLAIEAAIKATAAKRDTEAKLAEKKSQEAALLARMAALEKALEPQVITAWCADATEDATGQVATIEINGEVGDTGPQIIIAPREVLPTLPHGEVAAREVQSGAQAYFNAAVLPGWQKHKPTYRAGRIRDIDTAANTCRVDLDPARSSAENLDINQATTLTGVPVRYMTCDASAFEENDRVLVEFQQQDWAQPVVIGFVERPRPCEPMTIAMASETWGPRGSPAEPEDDEYYLPQQIRWAQYDPVSGELKHEESRTIEYEFGPWKSLFETLTCASNGSGTQSTAIAGAWQACSYGQFYGNPMAFLGKSWVLRASSMLDDPPRAMIAHDGSELILPAGMYMVSTAGRYIVGGTESAPTKLVVFDPAKNVIVAQHDLDGGYVYDTAGYANLAAVLVNAAADDWNPRIRVIDVNTGATVFTRAFEFAIADLAVNANYLALLIVDISVWRLQLYDLATGELVDDFDSAGVRAITMSAKYLVGVCADGEAGEWQGTPGGGVDVYRVLPTGLSYMRTDRVFPPFGVRGFPYAG